MLAVFLILAAAPPGPPQGMIRSALGVDRDGAAIECWLAPEDLDYHTSKPRVLVLGAPEAASESLRRRYAISVVPGPVPARGYPPQGEYYGRAGDPAAAYLWRWIGMHAPDLVVEIRAGPKRRWQIPEAPHPVLQRLARRLRPVEVLQPSDELVFLLARGAPAGTGPIPAVRAEGNPAALLAELLRAAGTIPPSPARREIQSRLDRTPRQVAGQLAAHYGHDLNEVMYQPALALIGRLRLGERADVERIVAPYFTGVRPALPAKPSGSHLSGHLVFGELASLTGQPRYTELVRAAADLDPMRFHNEMSDAVFMSCPLLARAGRLTGDAKYFDLCLHHMRFMLKLNLRTDGLHRHSPLDETAWGRGNGFPALGLALSLTDLPHDHPGRPEMLQAFRAHLEALARHQDTSGAWRQVIDHPGSYRELTATAMIGFALRRGIRSGWLDPARFQPLLDRAWYAVRARVAPNGELVDVCTGTGKQKSLRDYLDRAAILGPDPRGGAMALLLSTEMIP